VPHSYTVHHLRDRAEAFGAVAADYDRFRPGYPTQLIDDLVADRPRTVLDVGCGTGKAGALLAARGLDVLGVELDPQMAAVARGHGLAVEEASFEHWDDRGRRFDLITAAQAWHWVNPAIGAPKAAGLLNPGGLLALFWNFGEPEEVARAAIEDVHRRMAPQFVTPPGAGDDRTHVQALEATGCFRSIETHTYEFERHWPVDDWVGNLGTQSSHLLLGPERLAALLAEMRTALLRTGPVVRVVGGTFLVRARP
jgi:SAM-dependent methyltransferase